VDGEALVMHAGDKPYVVAPGGQVELATHDLNLDAVNEILNQLLPPDAHRTLDEIGAVRHQLSPIPEFPGEQFTVVAARGADDLWVEIRRRRTHDDDRAPDESFRGSAQLDALLLDDQPQAVNRGAAYSLPDLARPTALLRSQDVDVEPATEKTTRVARTAGPPVYPSEAEAASPAEAGHDGAGTGFSQPAVVLPLARNPIRPESPAILNDATLSGLDRLLRMAAARGASTLYLSSDSRPALRVDGELYTLDGEPVLTTRDVESLILTLMPERSHEALRTGAGTEWILDIEEIGRVRCMTFRDHRGPGGVFRLMPTRPVSVEQLGLPRSIQRLAAEPEGLVLVAGPRSSGKRTLISAFVDTINRSRHDHVITIEREINVVHDRGSSFVSQREVRGDDEALLAAARSALRENPDVLVIEDLRTAGLINVALDASSSGHLVIGAVSAHTAAEAIDRVIDLYGPDDRARMQLALAQALRGVVVQRLLKKNGGGRVAARELLLNTPAVASVIAEGKTSQLPRAIEGGRREGMIPLNDALASLVQQNMVDAGQAYRHSSDRQGLLAVLKHHGIDTSALERFA
jgi:twitching motility protein PilT